MHLYLIMYSISTFCVFIITFQSFLSIIALQKTSAKEEIDKQGK